MKIIAQSQKRLDQYLVELNIDKSRNFFTKLIKDKKILVNEKSLKPGFLLSIGDIIYIDDNFLEVDNSDDFEKINLNIEVLYEDKYLAVINKPINLITHPASTTKDKTLINGIYYLFNKNLSMLNTKRPGIVHRLDKNTSGCLIIAKDDKTHNLLVNMFKNRQIHKTYLTIVEGITHSVGKILLPLQKTYKNKGKSYISKEGKESLTNYKLISTNNSFSLLEVEIITGRTHQIRAHMQAINHPIIGDRLYGSSKIKSDILFLHSYNINFNHPILNKNINIYAPIPQRFLDMILKLNLKMIDK